MSKSETVGQNEGTEHLALVRSLSHEISSAISAIERNDLADLTSRVAAQEAICQKLNQNGAQKLKLACESYRATAESPAEKSLSQKIREAHLALARLNTVYAGLIRSSQKSIGLITNLYQNHGQRYSKEDNARPGKHTWSCEA